MRTRIRIRTLLVCSLLAGGVAAGPAAAGKLGTLALEEKPTALLGGRIEARLPAGARIEARQANVASANPLTEEETRVVVDAGGERMMILAYELFARSTADALEPAVKARWADPGAGRADRYAIEPRTLPSGQRAVLISPKAPPDPKREAWLALGEYVLHTDGTVQMVSYFLDPDAAKDVAGATALARKVADTVAPGPKRLATSAGERSFRGVQDTDKVVLVVPEGTVDTHQQAPDFAMHYFRILPKLGDGVPVLGIYVGKQPPDLHVQEEAAAKGGAKATVTKKKADLLATAGAEWHLWASGGVEHAEAIVPYPGRKEWAMHVFCAGATAAEIDRLVKIAATLRVAS